MKNQAHKYIQEWLYPPRTLCVTVFLAVIAVGCAVQTDPEKDKQSVAAVEPAPELIDESNQAHNPTSHREVKNSAIDVLGHRSMSEDRLAVMSRASAVPLANRVAGKVEGACCAHFTRWATEPIDRENYAHVEDNPVKLVAQHPVSTFSRL